MLISHTALALLIPMAKAEASVICSASNPTTASGSTPGCALRNFPTGAFAYPKLDWKPLGEFSNITEAGFKLKSAAGDKTIVNNDRPAAALGLTGSQIADAVTMFPTNVPFVFARYNPTTLNLFVDIFKIEKTGTKTVMSRAAFMPAHGDAFAASQIYSTPDARQLGLSAGPNPFALYNTPGDDVFHNVGKPAGVQVAVGLAMKMAEAPIGLVAMANSRVDSWTTSDSAWFTTTTTQHVQGYAKPDWYVVTPEQFSPNGIRMKSCIIKVSDLQTCPVEQDVQSGVAWTQWSGGNLPAFEDPAGTEWQHSESGLSLLSMIVIVFVASGRVAGHGPIGCAIGRREW